MVKDNIEKKTITKKDQKKLESTRLIHKTCDSGPEIRITSYKTNQNKL